MKNKEFGLNDKIIFKKPFILNNLENDIYILVVLSMLYEREIITLNKLKGQLKSLRKGDLQKYKRTFHNSINNRWYNDISAMNIFEELYAEFNLGVISISKLIEVVQLYTNTNYNSCINFIVSNILKLSLESFSNSTYTYLSEILEVTIESFPLIKHVGFKDECPFCGREHYHIDTRLTKERIQDIVKFFHPYKRGNLDKIPIQSL